MSILISIVRHAGSIRQRFLRCPATRQSALVRCDPCWTRAVAFAIIIASLAWGTTLTAGAQPDASNAGLSELSLYNDVTFSSQGTFQGVENFLEALVRSMTPHLGDQLMLTPAFAEGTTSYTVTIRQDMTRLALVASGNQPGTTIEVTGTGADGAPLKKGTNLKGNIKFKIKETDMRADIIMAFEQVPLGKNTITVDVTSEDGSTTQTTTVTVIRHKPDMDS